VFSTIYPPLLFMPRYDDYSREELVRLLEARDRRDATRFGLVWETNEVEREKALNGDFVALDLDAGLSTAPRPGTEGADAAWRNLIIEGDNFDALRFLRMAYAGRVKCICIDPPYNTGNRDFVYNDRYVDKDDAWRHSRWCEFMHQRLTLAKELLADDGVIFVHIDDNEMAALTLLMKQVFGEAAFVANCVWQKRYSRENRGVIGDAHEYVLVYSPKPEVFQKRRGLIALSDKQSDTYKNPNDDPKGPWATVSLTAQGFRPNQMYEIVAPNGKSHRPPDGRCWSTVESEFKKLVAANKIYWGKDGNGVPRIMRYLSEVEGLVPWTWWPHEEVGHTDESRKEIREIFGTQTAFDTPKPVRLLERILQIGCGPDDIVLDFFAGSGTTGHAVLKANAADGGRRRFILVSSTEATEEEPEKNLCRDVCAERVRRVIAGYGGEGGAGWGLCVSAVPADSGGGFDGDRAWAGVDGAAIDAPGGTGGVCSGGAALGAGCGGGALLCAAGEGGHGAGDSEAGEGRAGGDCLQLANVAAGTPPCGQGSHPGGDHSAESGAEIRPWEGADLTGWRFSLLTRRASA